MLIGSVTFLKEVMLNGIFDEEGNPTAGAVRSILDVGGIVWEIGGSSLLRKVSLMESTSILWS